MKREKNSDLKLIFAVCHDDGTRVRHYLKPNGLVTLRVDFSRVASEGAKATWGELFSHQSQPAH